METIEFSDAPTADLPQITCRTKDGLNLQLDVSFQYRVEPDEIYDLYNNYGTNQRTIMLRMAVDTVSATSTLFNADQFFTNKSYISQVMETQLNDTLKDKVDVMVVFF